MTHSESLVPIFSYFSGRDDDPPTKPWRHGDWLWATQGHVLVACRSDGSESEPTPERVRKGLRYLDEAPAVLGTTSLSKLQVFAGPVLSPDVKCARCHGSGREKGGDWITCEHCGQGTRPECGECGGRGTGWIDIAGGVIADIPFNRRLLAYALSRVPACERVDVGTMPAASNQRDNLRALVFEGDDWRIVLMGIQHANGDAPVFTALASPQALAAVDPVEGIVAPGATRE